MGTGPTSGSSHRSIHRGIGVGSRARSLPIECAITAVRTRPHAAHLLIRVPPIRGERSSDADPPPKPSPRVAPGIC